jgi:hypothetical protein
VPIIHGRRVEFCCWTDISYSRYTTGSELKWFQGVNRNNWTGAPGSPNLPRRAVGRTWAENDGAKPHDCFLFSLGVCCGFTEEGLDRGGDRRNVPRQDAPFCNAVRFTHWGTFRPSPSTPG